MYEELKNRQIDQAIEQRLLHKHKQLRKRRKKLGIQDSLAYAQLDHNEIETQRLSISCVVTLDAKRIISDDISNYKRIIRFFRCLFFRKFFSKEEFAKLSGKIKKYRKNKLRVKRNFYWTFFNAILSTVLGAVWILERILRGH